MNNNELMKIAAQYADMAIKDFDVFLKCYENDARQYSMAENYIIGKLIPVYCEYKKHGISRERTIELQRMILNDEYIQEI